jgi:hypothetical protein
LNTTVKNIINQNKVFTVKEENFTPLALAIFQFQHQFSPIYRQYCDLLKIDPLQIDEIEKIPFLPIRFFKSHQVMTTDFTPAITFESSGTSQTVNSKHFVKEISLYSRSFNETFRLFYGDPSQWCIIALLPSYLERNNSSLVMMADELIQQSGHPKSGFYLNEWNQLNTTLQALELAQQKTMLIGVTFALLDFVEKFPQPLHHTTIMETGGMKGRREEITRGQVHEILCKQFGVEKIHSEYGMTELLSQAYSKGEGIFNCPPWMKVLIREEDDPFAIQSSKEDRLIRGAINCIDLANIYSCSFLATEDAGKLYPDGSFELLGRLDNTDIRGCSLLTV